MAFDSNGNFTGATATSLSSAGITTITGTTSTVVGNVTHYFTNRPVSIQATLSYDATKEVLHIVSGTSNSVTVTGSGNFTIRGGKASASFGNNERLDTTPLALSSSKSGPGCCSGGSITIQSGGRLNLYGVRIDLNSVLDWQNGSGGIIRNSVIFSHNSDTNTRIRCQGATNWDIDGLKLSGIQFDWLTDQVFAKFVNFLPTDRGIPIENAIGSIGAQRLWRQLPDSRGSADASMNNWTAQKDVVIQLAEAGTGAIIVPDSANGSGSGGHGGRIYHEFTPTASASSGNKNGKAFVRDTNHSKRKATTSAGSIDMTADQFIVTPITAGVGATTSIMIGMWYRNNSVGDLNSPDGNEILDARGKNDVTAVVANDATRDLFDIYFKGLDYAPASATNQQLNGLSVTPVGFGLLVDTERDSDTLATINAYTSVDTTQKAYNAMKAWGILDANLETPSSTSFVLTKQGEVLNGGTYAMTFDGSAGANFNFSSNLATIKSATFNGDITTTGDITLQAIAENRTVKNASTVTLATYPTAITADNTIINVAGTLNVSNWTFLNGASLRLTANATISTGGNSSVSIDANGFVLTRDDSIPVTFNGFPTGSGIGSLAVIEELDGSNMPLGSPVYIDLTPNETTGIGIANLKANTKYRYTGDALGHYRGSAVYFDTTVTSLVTVGIEQILDAANNPAYGNGVAAQMALLSLTPSPLEMLVEYNGTVNNGVISYASILDKSEQLLTSHGAIKAGYRQPRYATSSKEIIFPSDTTLKVSDKTGNTARPEIDAVIRKADAQTPFTILVDTWKGKGLNFPTTIVTADISNVPTKEDIEEIVIVHS